MRIASKERKNTPNILRPSANKEPVGVVIVKERRGGEVV
jgi:hypothetical protein